jgi:FkbM family methyltransferase
MYYYLYNDRVINISYPEVLSGKNWIINKDFGRAYYKGYYEPAITHFLEKNLNQDSIFFDIGAHAGYFSLIASQIAKRGKVVSFEPMARNFEFINQIKNINSIQNWEVYNYAISDSIGELGFIFGQTSSTGTVVPGNEGEISVKSMTLDEFINQSKTYPDFIKIDVEGHGDKVLKGFKLLNNYPKKILILLEVHKKSNEINFLVDALNLKQFEVKDLKNNLINLKTDIIPSHIILSNKGPN